MAQFEHDVIIIGSGFGGAVAACRLAEAGVQRVLVLERGRRWTPKTYPRDTDDAWLWDQDDPEHHSGWADLRSFGDMTVAAGAGVGGGSLIYANVSVEAKPAVFADGRWPDIDHATLKPHYDEVGRMLDLQELPDAQFTARTKLMKEGADKLGWGDRFRKLPLAVSFAADFDPDAPGARDDRNSRPFTNLHGMAQGTCVHCGNCDIGCQVSAKNTLDLNYLAVAERKGATVLPLHVVRSIAPLGDGWTVQADKIDVAQRSSQRVSFTAQRVVVAAGSIGSTELLLRCRDEHRTLPQLSPRLGLDWAFNGDFVTPTFYGDARPISPSHGPTITCAIDLLDGSFQGQKLFVEDGGIPSLAGNFIRERLKAVPGGKLRDFWLGLGRAASADDPSKNMMPWFGQAIDAGNGRLSIGRIWYMPWKRQLKMDWDYRPNEAVVNAMVAAHERLSEATGGKPFVPPTWTLLRNIVTPHPLGGCNMGRSIADGVVDGFGKVFGQQNLYVLDGAIVPRPVGLNPSRTIAALAERGVKEMIRTL